MYHLRPNVTRLRVFDVLIRPKDSRNCSIIIGCQKEAIIMSQE